MTKPSGYIDYTAIAFPSDELTIGNLRKLNGSLLDSDSRGIDKYFSGSVEDFIDSEFGSSTMTGGHEYGDVELLSLMLKAERDLARHAYEKACGKPLDGTYEWEPLPKTRDRLVAELKEVYTHFKIASGPTHTDQLVRDFEAQAAAQVTTPQGRSSQHNL